MEKIFNLKIDTKNKNISTVNGLKQFDNNSILKITLLQNNLALDLTNCTVRLNFLREDKKVLLYMADIVSAKEGKVSINLSPEVLEKTGNVKVDISVFDINLLKITSATFNMKVEESIYSNDYYLNLKDFDIVQRMHIEEEKRIANENKRIESESARITDEKKRSDAEELRNEKETERISNEEKRVQAENKRNEDEHIRIEAENKRNECESNRIDEEKIRVENEKARSKSEDQRKIADNTMAENELARITYEQQRQANEKARTEKETKRITDEKLRTEAEDKRLEAEKLRVEKEAERANSENTRVTAEQKRETNETNRVEAEKTRVKEWDKIKNTFKDNAPGDMKKAVYDKDNDGIVDIADDAKKLAGIEAKEYALKSTIEENNKALTEQLEQLKNNISNANVIEKTYAELKELKDNKQLKPGCYYKMTDYRTKYLQPITKIIKESDIEEIILIATSNNTFGEIAYSEKYPSDIIQYNFNLDEISYNDTKTPTTGCITRRTDFLENSAPYDFRNILFARWTIDPNEYYYDNKIEKYKTWESGSVERGYLYKINNGIYLSIDNSTPSNGEDQSVFTPIIYDITIPYLYKDKIQLDSLNDKKDFFKGSIKLKTGELKNLPTFNGTSYGNYLSYSCSNTVFIGSSGGNFLNCGCNNNTFGGGCYYNYLGADCDYNIFINSGGNYLAHGCSSNILKIADNNTFDVNASCNFLSNNSSYNKIGVGCSDNFLNCGCSNNFLGPHVYGNFFGYGSCCNVFGSECFYNFFGNGFKYNVFGSNCRSNIFGNNCSHNVVNDSSYNTFIYLLRNVSMKQLYNRNLSSLSDIYNKSYNITITKNVNNEYVYGSLNSSNEMKYTKIP